MTLKEFEYLGIRNQDEIDKWIRKYDISPICEIILTNPNNVNYRHIIEETIEGNMCWVVL